MIDLNDVKSKMIKALDIIRADLGTIRTGRATPSLVENVVVSVYGGSQKLKLMEVGTISVLDSRTLMVAPYDSSIVEEISKGIQVANIGLTPVIDGEIIRLSIPSLTEERRLEYIKLSKQKLESGKIMIRQLRHEMMDQVKKSLDLKEISEDDQKRLEKDLQTLTDEMTAEIDEMGRKKEEELMQI